VILSACKKDTIVDYRDKWCGDYNFVYYFSVWSPAETTYDTVQTSGNIYYENEMQDNQLFIQNGTGYELGLISIDTFGIINLPSIYRGSQRGYFINNDTLYYSYVCSSGQSNSVSLRMFGYKKK